MLLVVFLRYWIVLVHSVVLSLTVGAAWFARGLLFVLSSSISRIGVVLWLLLCVDGVSIFTLDCVLVFINMASSLRAPEPFSFSSPNLAAELSTTFWLLAKLKQIK